MDSQDPQDNSPPEHRGDPQRRRSLIDWLGLRGRLTLGFLLLLGLSLAGHGLVLRAGEGEAGMLSALSLSAAMTCVLMLPLVYALVHRLTRPVRELERKVLQRTAELENANRWLSAEIAEKEDLLRAVSHDLNAPLRNISGMAATLLMKYRDRFEQDVVHRLERIQKNVEAETELISGLLELSRIRSRRQRMEVVEVDALVCELVSVFENDLKSRRIELKIDTPLPALLCERARIRQVFLNLIDNAIKYMGDLKSENPDPMPAAESGGGTPQSTSHRIRIGCLLRTDAAEFYVQDTGVGIDAEDQEKIFHIFRRGKAAAGQAALGKGVGLASVKSIVGTYGGRIWVESQIGRGSTFRFTISGIYVPALAGESHVESRGRARM